METNSYIDDTNDNTDTLFDLLCNEILDIIVSYSDLSIIDKFNIIKVCNKSLDWINDFLINVSVINRKTLLRTSHLTISSNDLALIISKCLNVKHIDLSHIRVFDQRVVTDAAHRYCDNSSVVIMSAIAQYCHQLESINFGLLDVNNEQFVAIVTNCPQLKQIASKTINDDTLRHISESPKLEALDLSGNTKISGEALENIGPNITELNLNTSLIDLKTLLLQDHSDEELDTLCKSCKSPIDRHKVIGNTVNSDKIHDNYFKIEKLSVCITSKYALNFIAILFDRLTHIGLNVTRSSDCDLQPLLAFPTLTSVSISANRFEDCMHALHRNIQEIEVTGGDDYKLTDNSLIAFRRFSRRLRKLVLRQFSGITDYGMQSIGELRNLQHLDLMNCENIGDDGIVWVIRSCDRLRVLNLHNCALIGEPVLKAFIIRCDKFSNDKFTLDVVNTGITKVDKSVAMPPNLNLLVNIDQCVYDCWHTY